MNSDKMTKIHIIRHGETTWNSTMRWQGHSDVPLSDRGHQQAQKMAGFWNGKLDAVYSSDLMRAIQTAEYLPVKDNTSPIQIAAFKEICFGDWEGLTTDEIKTKWGGSVDSFFDDPDSIVPPNGESFRDVYERCVPAYQQLLEKHAGQEIAIVAHGGVTRMLLCHLLCAPISSAWNMKQDNTAINTALHLTTPSGKARVFIENFNDTSHLKYTHR